MMGARLGKSDSTEGCSQFFLAAYGVRLIWNVIEFRFNV